MRAIQVHEPGGPEVLSYEETPAPEPKEGEALVRVAASGVNFIDVYQREGRYPLPTPFVPGNEGAGVVEAVGPGVADLAPGDRVAWASHLGSYAELAAVPAWKLVSIPDELDFARAAAAMLQGMTAH